MNFIRKKAEYYETRSYQKEAIMTSIDFVKDIIRNILLENNGIFKTASLLEMATGSGKILTVGKILEKLILLRNRYNSKNKQNKFKGLNVLVLSNRIDGVNQFKRDLVDGRNTLGDERPPILSDDVLKNFKVSIFHSRADNLEDLEEIYITENEETEEIRPNISPKMSEKSNEEVIDNLFFSTFQTASIKELEKRLPYIDIIIIDESHNISLLGEFSKLLRKLALIGRDKKTPYILPVSATPTDITRILFGDPAYSFGLAEYLASEYSPNVEYEMIISSNKKGNINYENINNMLNEAKNEKNHKEKKRKLGIIKSLFDELIGKYPDINYLGRDILNRVKEEDGEIKETIVFASSIKEANELERKINLEYGSEIALAYHSKNDKNKALERFKNKDGKVKILIAVSKLNESVDIPEVRNVVILKDTNKEYIYLQQIGRGLRGKGTVRYFDYVGGIRNFAILGDILKRAKTLSTDRIKNTFNLKGRTIYPQSYEDDNDFFSNDDSLFNLGIKISDMVNEKKGLTIQEIIDFFKGKGDLEYWKQKRLRERKVFNLNGYSLNNIARIIGIKGYPANNINAWYDLLEIIFDTKIERIIPKNKEEISRDDIIEFFKKDGKNIDNWKDLTEVGKLGLEIKGNKIIAISRIFGIEGNILKDINLWYDLLECIFGEKVEIITLTKEEVINFFKEGGNIDYWENYTTREINRIRIKGIYTIQDTVKILGINLNLTKNNKNTWYLYLEEIFGEKIVIEEIIEPEIEEIVKYFKRMRRDYWEGLSAQERTRISVKGFGFFKIARKLGIFPPGQYSNSSGNFAKILDFVYSYENKV